MPSPVGHAIGGLIAGWTIAGAPAFTADTPAADRRIARRAALLRACRHSAPFALLAMAPDLDLLVGLHSRYTHSLGAAAIAAILAFTIVSARRASSVAQAAVWHGRARTFALACGGAWASHVLLDWLGSDTSPPLGIMALWPLSSNFFQSDLGLFLATDRRYWLPGFVARNLYALMWELIVLLPLLLIAGRLRRPAPAPRVRPATAGTTTVEGTAAAAAGTAAGERRAKGGLPRDIEADRA